VAPSFDYRAVQAWVQGAEGYVVYRLRKDPSHPLGGVVELVGPSIETVLGASDATDMTTWFEAVHPDDLPRVLDAQFVADRHGEVFDEAFRVRHGGTTRWVRAVSHPEADPDGVVTHYNGLIVDVTAQVRASEEVRRAREALVHVQSQSTERLRSQGVVHDLNHLLQTILAAAHIARHDADDEAERGDLLEQVEAAAEQAGRLSSQLLVRSSEVVEEVDLVARVGAAATLFRSAHPDLDLAVDLPEGPVWVRAIASQVDQVVLNLLLNARQASPSPPPVRLTLRASEPAETAALVVDDEGPGVSPAMAGRLFEPGASTRPGGSGLGLAASRAALERVGGRLVHEPGPGGVGARFVASWPRSEPAVDEGPAAVFTGAHHVLQVVVGVDDDALRELLVRTVQLAGHEVVAAEGAAVPDVVLCRWGSARDVVTWVQGLRSSWPQLAVVCLHDPPRPVGTPVTGERWRWVQQPAKLDELQRALVDVVSS